MSGSTQGSVSVPRVRHVRTDDGTDGAQAPDADHVAVEEPLQIRVLQDPWLTTMRTPGHDRELVLGLLFSEGIIHGKADVSSLVHCGDVREESFGNVMQVTFAPGSEAALSRFDHKTHALPVGSSCGLCGREVIADLLERAVALPELELPSSSTLLALATTSRRHQPIFEQTGGLHAASLFRADGEWIETFEDVGRHNAVDKVIGSYLWRHGSRPEGAILSVSGRASFEIVQKAIVAGCRAVVSVSAPSSLAVATAHRFRLGLVGFARDESFNVYADPSLWATDCGPGQREEG